MLQDWVPLLLLGYSEHQLSIGPPVHHPCGEGKDCLVTAMWKWKSMLPKWLPLTPPGGSSDQLVRKKPLAPYMALSDMD